MSHFEVHGMHQKVLQHIALQCSDELRANFIAEVSVCDPSMFIWIDETGCGRHHSMRKHAYGIRPPRDHQLLIRGTRSNYVFGEYP